MKKALEKIKELLLKSKKELSILLAISTPLYIYLFYDTVISCSHDTLFLISMLSNLTVTFVVYNLIWAIICSLLPKIKYVIYTISYVFLLADMYCISLYKNQFNEPLLTIVLDTNLNETLEYLSVHLDIKKIFVFILLNILLFILYKVFFYLLNKDKVLKILTPVNIIILIIISFCINNVPTLYSIPINHFFTLSSFVIQEKFERESGKDWEKENSIVLEENNSSIPYVVLILGESTSKTHMHLYGHKTPNTPRLEEKVQNKEAVAYTDTFSGDTYTLASVAKLFYFYNSFSTKKYYKYHNIIDILNLAGYKTFWLSNQAMTGEFSSVQYTLAEKCDYMQFTSNNGDRQHLKTALYDEALFPIIDDVLENKVSDKNFIVIHLIGTHMAYSQRYPKEYNKFISNEDDEKAKNIHNYDNAILYNDYVVSTIMDKFKDKNALVIYLSDHGEDVSEPDGSQNGHYIDGTVHQKMIPLIFWGSDSFKKQYSKKWEEIERDKDKFLSTDNFILPFLKIMEIETQETK